MIYQGRDQKGKGDYCCSTTQLGMRLGVESGGTGGEVKICSQPTRFPGRSSLCIKGECLLELRAGIKQWGGGQRRPLGSTGACREGGGGRREALL